VPPALRAIEVRGDENLSAHGSLHRALAAARLKDGAMVYDNVRKIIGNDMLFRSLMTSHNPGLDTYNADAANALPAILGEALVYSRPGILELLPAVPDELSKGTITGVRCRNRILVESLSWDIEDGGATVVVTSDITQDITLISRRGMTSVTTNAPVAPSPLGDHARLVTLTAGTRTSITVGLPTSTSRRVSRNN
jgi:hypothetical protein